MLLVHGTTEAVARNWRKGLSPRRGMRSNWKTESRKDCVYLSETYAPYFAACKCHQKPWGFVEVETDELDTFNLLPDEDFLEQTTRGKVGLEGMPNSWDTIDEIHERTIWFRDRLEQFQHHWKDSVVGLGNLCYKGKIPQKAIKRVVVYDPKSNPFMSHEAKEPVIILMNHRFCARRYKALTEWFLGGTIMPESLSMSAVLWDITPESHKSKIADILTQTKGIEIIK